MSDPDTNTDDEPEDGDARIRVRRSESIHGGTRIRIVRDGYAAGSGGWYAQNAIVAPSEEHLSELVDEIEAFLSD
jgi:hypothetical protein